MDGFIGVCSTESNFSSHQFDITPLLILLYIKQGNKNRIAKQYDEDQFLDSRKDAGTMSPFISD